MGGDLNMERKTKETISVIMIIIATIAIVVLILSKLGLI